MTQARLAQIIIGILATLIVIGIALLVYTKFEKETVVIVPEPEPTIGSELEQATDPRIHTIGQSVEGRGIEAYTFGTGPEELLFVGGIHGGYEWNSVLLAYEFIDHLTVEPSLIADNLTITIIPSLNPDGLFAVVQKEGRFLASDIPKDTDESIGRFNANGVDINRNFDCKWQPKSSWRGKQVSAGTAAFSEPESLTFRDYILKERPVGVVFWHSQANAVYASECTEGILPKTRTLMDTYASAAGYPAVDSFDAYPVTGDAEGWLASIGIPAITVELANHTNIEWERNLKGVVALIEAHALAR